VIREERKSHHELHPGAWMGGSVRCIDEKVLVSAVAQSDTPLRLSVSNEPGSIDSERRHRKPRTVARHASDDPWVEYGNGGKYGPKSLRVGDSDPKELAA
jgi:hypothetical protein